MLWLVQCSSLLTPLYRRHKPGQVQGRGEGGSVCLHTVCWLVVVRSEGYLLVGQLVGWLVGQSVGWSVGRSVDGWSVGYLVGRLVSWSVSQYRSVGWLVGWLVG